MAGVLFQEPEDPEEREELWYRAAEAVKNLSAGAMLDFPDSVVARLEELVATEPAATYVLRGWFEAPSKGPRFPFPIEAEPMSEPDFAR